MYGNDRITFLSNKSKRLEAYRNHLKEKGMNKFNIGDKVVTIKNMELRMVCVLNFVMVVCIPILMGILQISAQGMGWYIFLKSRLMGR